VIQLGKKLSAGKSTIYQKQSQTLRYPTIRLKQSQTLRYPIIRLKKYTFEEFKTEFNGVNDWDMPIGTWFWDEFGDLEAQYGLNKDESKLLGRWMNVTFTTSLYYHYSVLPQQAFL
jgi:hypothetical protein